MDRKQAIHKLKNVFHIGNEVGVALDVAIKSMDKLEQIEQIVNTAKAYRPTLDSEDVQAICKVLESED